jgi:hypothetical protein
MPTIIAHMAKTKPAMSPAAPARTADDADAPVSREIAVALIARSSILLDVALAFSLWTDGAGVRDPRHVMPAPYGVG